MVWIYLAFRVGAALSSLLMLPQNQAKSFYQMADPLAEESQKYCVGGLVPYNETKARYYLMEVIGRKERIPLRFGLTDGAEEVEMCMRARYGAAYTSEFGTLLNNQLAPSEDDNEIWGPWRSEYAVITELRVAAILIGTQFRFWLNINAGKPIEIAHAVGSRAYHGMG